MLNNDKERVLVKFKLYEILENKELKLFNR